MKNLIGVLALALVPTLAAAAEKPDWAFPVTDKVQPPPRFEASRVRPAPPGSTLSITRAKADDMYDIPNWFPQHVPGDARDRSIRQQGEAGARLRLLSSADRHGPR